MNEAIQLCISEHYWNIGKPISSINEMSNKFKITKYNAKKTVSELLSNGNVEKFGNKFFLISTDLNDSPTSIQNRLVNKARIHLDILNMLQKNWLYDQSTVSFIQFNGMIAKLYFPITKRVININVCNIHNTAIETYLYNILKRHNII